MAENVRWTIEMHPGHTFVVDGQGEKICACPGPDSEAKARRIAALPDSLWHLRKLLEAGCEDRDSQDDLYCRFCDARLWETPPNAHEPDCPYVAARAFVEAIASGSPAPPSSGASPPARRPEQ
jgi:hypothetical protein